MTFFLGLLSIVLIGVLLVQIGKARELASAVRNDKAEEYEVNNVQAGLGMVFMVILLVSCIASFIYYTPYMLGWGPFSASSEHGPEIDYMFNLTLFFTAIVFFVTQALLYWFGWKYRGKRGRKALYWAHNEKLEMIWMILPAVVMTFLVVGGLQSWNKIMADVGEDEVVGKDYVEIEARGMQFAWLLRHPGRDGKLGTTDFRKIDGSNALGQDFTDKKNVDDLLPDKIVLPVGKKVRVRITSRDVLHNFYIRDMRVKMDAVPGMPTYFVFTPTVTTDSMRRRLSKLPEWQVPDVNDDTKERWETYDYELACAELCGRSHYSMRRIVRIVSEEEYEEWLDEQEGDMDEEGNGAKSFYMANIRTSDKPYAEDVFAGITLDYEKILAAKTRVKAKYAALEEAYDAAYEAKSANFMALDAAMEEMKGVLSIARTTNDVTEAEEAVRNAERIAQQVLGAPVIEMPMDTTAVDSVVMDSTIINN